jgi:transcriptional regulator with XRE-family HTH domain
MENPFGIYIRDRRNAERLSLRDVADRLGISHVYLSEVERGVRPPFTRDRWPDLAASIRGITIEDLERKFATSRPIQLDLVDAPPVYQDLGAALARRISQRDLDKGEMQVLLDMFCKDKK